MTRTHTQRHTHTETHTDTHIHTHRETHTETHTHTQRHKHTHTQTHRHTQRHTRSDTHTERETHISSLQFSLYLLLCWMLMISEVWRRKSQPPYGATIPPSALRQTPPPSPVIPHRPGAAKSDTVTSCMPASPQEPSPPPLPITRTHPPHK